MDFDDSDTPLPPGFLFDETRKNTGARESENERLRLWEENRALKEEVKALRIKLAKCALDLNRVRRPVSPARKKEVKP
jgi:hypothetical protein